MRAAQFGCSPSRARDKHVLAGADDADGAHDDAFAPRAETTGRLLGGGSAVAWLDPPANGG